MARYTAEAGFDTWILEVRGAGLSKREGEPTAIEQGGADGILSGAVQDSIVGATIRGATRATSHMEKHIEENQAEKEHEAPTEHQSPLTKDSNGASLGHTSAPVVDKHIGPQAEQKVEKAIGEKKDAKVQEEEPRSSWVTGRITRMASRYMRMVRVNQESLLSGKYIKKVGPVAIYLKLILTLSNMDNLWLEWGHMAVRLSCPELINLNFHVWNILVHLSWMSKVLTHGLFVVLRTSALAGSC